ncbi:MAG: hypothetical protein HLUCCX14_01410 [Marinobacter excellens HL-55]|uniref:Uncharacterized protein n=1 Tax=Marinobacter excellens HL-55 TaxID=1305731 RepID=A0A0P7YL07_9GAMM|nr:MAG: hypothetical protein HLUCCX14_01410 [Marinobacter excellens HL-55]
MGGWVNCSALGTDGVFTSGAIGSGVTAGASAMAGACVGAGSSGIAGCSAVLAEAPEVVAAMVSLSAGVASSGRSLRTEAKPAVTRSINARALTNSSGLKSTMMEPLDPNLPDALLWFHLTHCLQRYVTESV